MSKINPDGSLVSTYGDTINVDALRILDALDTMIAILPDDFTLKIVKDSLPAIINDPETPNEEVVELITNYRNRNVPALKKFVARMFDDAKRQIEEETQ